MLAEEVSVQIVPIFPIKTLSQHLWSIKSQRVKAIGGDCNELLNLYKLGGLYV